MNNYLELLLTVNIFCLSKKKQKYRMYLTENLNFFYICRFTINLQNGTAPYPPPDIAFHFDVRFFNFTVVRNTRCNNAWAAEETTITHFPFQPAVNFDMIIKVESDKYMVALNGQHFLEFRHRLTPLSRFDTLYIENDIVVSSIRFA